MRGQALALFVVSLTTVLAAGALALDGGLMLLERRDQQNAADAAAMAGARYVTTNHDKARAVARDVATANGFTLGIDAEVVSVDIPPTSGKFATWPNAVQVRISSTRPSILAGILGFLSWHVGASATAASLDRVGGPFSILALEPGACEAIKVAGTGGIVANGNIQVNSDCSTSALKRQAGGNISVIATGASCNVVGGFQDGGGSGTLECGGPDGDPYTGVGIVPDPLKDLPAVWPVPGFPAAPTQLDASNKSIPRGCPGSSRPATLAAPNACQFSSSYQGSAWRLFPGLYPGGLKLLAGSFYLEPGVYYLGGGGLDISGNGSVTQTVMPGTTTYGGGVLFFNTQLPNTQLPTAASSPLGALKLDGASANIHLLPLKASSGDYQAYNGLVIYQDRAFSLGGDDLTVNGNDADGMDVRGTIYLPTGDVKINGNEGDLVIDQIIAMTFDALGNGGDILALKETEHIYQFTAAGLVE
jgi:hypothetical protein